MDQDFLTSHLYVEPTSASSIFSYDGLPGDLLSENNPPPLDHGVDGDDDADIDDEEVVTGVIDNLVRSLGSTNASSDAQKSSLIDGVTSESFFLNIPEIDTKTFFYDSSYFMLDQEEKTAPKALDMNITNPAVVSDDFDQQAFNNNSATHNTNNANSLDITSMNNLQVLTDKPVEGQVPSQINNSNTDNINSTTASSESALLEQPDLLMTLIPSHNQRSSPESEFTSSKPSPEVSSILSSPSKHDLSVPTTTTASDFFPYSSHNSPALPSPPQQLPLPELRSRTNSSSSVTRPGINKLSVANTSIVSSMKYSSAADLTPLPTDPIRTDEERKRRNRIYAKRSRDLKNQKYKELMDKNKIMERKMEELTRENNELKLNNQRMDFKIKELEQQLRFYGIDGGKQDLNRSCF